MATKKHSFSLALMIDAAISDAVHSDIVVIKKTQQLTIDEQVIQLQTSFNLSETLAKKIVNEKLYVALIEASTLINSQPECLSMVRTLRSACDDIKDHYLIKKMVEKYELIIDLFAQGMNPYQKEILQRMEISRRAAYSLRDILDSLVDKKKSSEENKTQENSTRKSKKIKTYILKDVCENIDSIKQKVSESDAIWYKDVRVILEISRASGININEMKDDVICNIISQLEN